MAPLHPCGAAAAPLRGDDAGLGDAVFDEIFHPIGDRVARRCDACLRIGGPSVGAEAMVAIFTQAGRPVYRSLAEVPGCA